MLYIILMLNIYPVLALPAREVAQDEVALVALSTTAQERDLQGVRLGRHVEWGEAGAPKIVPVRVVRVPRWNIQWSTGALGCECAARGWRP